MTGRVSLGGLAECEMSVEGDTRRRRGGGWGWGWGWVREGVGEHKSNVTLTLLLFSSLDSSLRCTAPYWQFDLNLKTRDINEGSTTKRNSSVINM